MLQEISTTSVPITRNEEVSLLWHNNILTVRTEKEIFFYEYSYNLQCLDKNIDLVTCSIPVSKSSPLTEYVPEHFLKEGVSNIDYTEMILDPGLWPHNPELVAEMTNIADLQWSPPGILPGNEPALAVLNNIGNVEVYGRGRYGWCSLLDLSEIFKHAYLSSNTLPKPKTLKQLKKVAYTLETSAISWGPKLANNSCLFAMTQKNGDISIWILMHNDHGLKAENLCEIDTNMGEVVSMIWILKPDKQFAIIFSNVYGQIFSLDCCISDGRCPVKITSKYTVWPQKDKMIAKYMCYNIIDDKIILICNKHRHLMVIVLDKNCHVLTHFVRNVNDYRITDIKSNDYGIFLTTVNCNIYRIILHISDGNLNFDLELIPINNDSYSTHDMYSIALSSNNVIWVTAMRNRKPVLRQKSPKTLELVFFYVMDVQPDELTILMQNPLERLTNLWDCIELLRYKTSKTKIMPLVDYDFLYQKADKDIYKLKLYHVFLHFFLSLEKRARNRERKMLPEISLDVVKEKILTLHATQLINEVLEKYKNSTQMLENIELDSSYGAKKYLEYYCEKYERLIGEFVNTKELLKHIPKIEERSVCQCCDEEVHGFTCNSGHFNMFCSVTFTPIDGYDYLVCKSCDSTASSDVYLNNTMCTFCDLYLSDFNLPT